MVVRLDLADLADREFGAQVARAMGTHLGRDRTSATILICYVEAMIAVSWRVPAQAIDAFENFESQVGEFFPSRGHWIVDPENYYIVNDDGLICAPGRPLSDLGETAVNAQMVFNGSVVAKDRRQLTALPAVSRTSMRAAGVAAAAWSPPEGDIREWRRNTLRIWRTEVARMRHLSAGPGCGSFSPAKARLRPTAWGRLVAGLGGVVVRDAVLLALIPSPGFEDLPERTLESDAYGDQVGHSIGLIMDPHAGAAPDSTIVEPSKVVLRAIVAHAGTRSERAPALTLLALIAWWQGKGAEAGEWMDLARAANPAYRLAALLEGALTSGMPPGWAREDAA